MALPVSKTACRQGGFSTGCPHGGSKITTAARIDASSIPNRVSTTIPVDTDGGTCLRGLRGYKRGDFLI